MFPLKPPALVGGALGSSLDPGGPGCSGRPEVWTPQEMTHSVNSPVPERFHSTQCHDFSPPSRSFFTLLCGQLPSHICSFLQQNSKEWEILSFSINVFFVLKFPHGFFFFLFSVFIFVSQCLQFIMIVFLGRSCCMQVTHPSS